MAAAPAVTAMSRGRSSPSSRSSSFARRPKQRINTTDAVIGTRTAAVNLSSSGSSPTSSSPRPTEPGTITTNTSIQPSPESLRAYDQDDDNHLIPVTAPLRLPEATLSGSPPRTAMSDAVSTTKSTGLIRRISRGAANKLSRRRTSTTGDDRDQSSGPMVRRRPSEGHGGGLELTRADMDDMDDGFDDVDELNEPLGLVLGSESPMSGSRTPQGAPTSSTTLVAGVGPVIPISLQRGTNLTKVTKRKSKMLKFVLDPDAAKVVWDPSKPTKRFYIDDIREVRTGRDARNYREECQVPIELEDHWFTVIVAEPARSKGRPFKAIHLIASNEVTFRMWVTTLEQFSQYRMNIMTGVAGQDETAIRALWTREMGRTPSSLPRTDQSERLRLDGVERLCRSLHLNCAKTDLRLHFARADQAGAGSLDFAGFKEFIRALKERHDLEEIYTRAATDPEAGLDRAEFMKFLRDSQGVDMDREIAQWEQVFDRCARQARSTAPSPIVEEEKDQEENLDDENEDRRLKFQAFAAFLMSPDNSALLRPSRSVVLDRPLNEYFISSSHNTYLLGRQVAGESSTEPYIWALQRGCRCIEIDCWDGPDGRPQVNHGRTLTTSVLFADCISVIQKYAFVSTPYPLVISLEVHCGPEQQHAMADILKHTLGDQLLRVPLPGHAFELPSPEELKHRILIKVKAGDEVDETTTPSDAVSGRRHRSVSSPSTGPGATSFARPSGSGAPPNSTPGTPNPQMRSPSVWDGTSARRHLPGGFGVGGWPGSATEDSDGREGPTCADRKEKKKRKIKPSKITKPLGDLAVYTRGQKFGGFSIPESFTYNHVYSFSERTFDGVCKEADSKVALEQHNVRCLMRVYPAAYRITSSNFDPNKFWRRGVQMAALNWQTYDLGLQMNEAMFAAGTDWTGYVLKPKELRPLHREPLMAGPALPEKKDRKLVRFSVEIISAHQLPRPNGAGSDQTVDPYVELETFCADDQAKGVAVGEGGQDASARHGMSGIGSPHRRLTRIVSGNGYNPVFRDRLTVSVVTKFPSLVFLRWTVRSSLDGRYGEKNPRLATFTAKLDGLQGGYRHLPLYDRNGEQFLFATLFVRLHKEAAVTLSHDDVQSDKAEGLRSFGRSMFGRTLSVERKSSIDDH